MKYLRPWLFPTSLMLACGVEPAEELHATPDTVVDPNPPPAAPAPDPTPPALSGLIARFTADPMTGDTPLDVTLDATSTTDERYSVATVQVRWDFEGDGTWDTPYLFAKLAFPSYDQPGSFSPRMEARNLDGVTSIAAAPAPIVVTGEPVDPVDPDPIDPIDPDPTQRPPVVSFIVEPTSGGAPLVIRVDATGSYDPDDLTTALRLRCDFDGNGTWDTPLQTSFIFEHEFTEPGVYWVRVEGVDADNLHMTATAPEVVEVTSSVVTPPAGARLNLLADSNRDGVVDAQDDAVESEWTATRGAIVMANLDDDDQSGERDADDDRIGGWADVDDMAVLRLTIPDGLQAGDQVVLDVLPASAGDVIRIFLHKDDSYWVVHEPGRGAAPLPEEDLAGELELWLEALVGPYSGWDGAFFLRATHSRGGQWLAQDVVSFRVAPTVFPDDIQTAEKLYVMRIDSAMNGENSGLFQPLSQKLDPSVDLYAIDEFRYGADRWVQDNMQLGYQAVPGSTARRVVPTYMETQRPAGLEMLLPGELLGPDLGYIYPGGSNTSLNYGGNLEVAPPHTGPDGNFPLGRILVGGGSDGTLYGTAYADRMNRNQRQWLSAQGVQAPLLELSTEWLAVGHLDEMFMFVPDLSPQATRGWKLLFASPSLALQALRALAQQGRGSTVVFAGRPTQTTVAGILSDSDLMTTNDLAQARIDSVRTVLARSLGLSSADVVYVPVIYESLWYDGGDLAVAYSPGIQNLLFVENTVFAPDPEGPKRGGQDVWRTQTLQALQPLGLDVNFVDVFESYHLLMGEVHCGINMQLAPYATNWWEVQR